MFVQISALGFQFFDFRHNCLDVDGLFLLERIDIARDVEVVVVLFNLFQGGAMAVFLDFGTIPVGLDNFLDMFRTELILRFNLFELA